MTFDLIFVCVSNRVRSVFAEFVFSKMLKERDQGLAEEVKVSSAGLVPKRLRDLLTDSNIRSPNPFYNRDMSEITREALRNRGIATPVQWKSKELTSERVREADLIITALADQKQDLLDLCPESSGKIHTAREISKSGEYLLQEDFSAVPMDHRFWDYCEENVDYVSRVISEMEEILQRAFPHIVKEILKHKQGGENEKVCDKTG